MVLLLTSHVKLSLFIRLYDACCLSLIVLVFFPFQPDLVQTGEEEITRDISRLEDKYHEQVTNYPK